MLSLAVHHNWDIQQIDINNAFLNGELAENVFMVQPEGFSDLSQPKHVCKLHKALYGLKQAPRAWFDKLRSALLEWGFINSTSDVSLFFFKKGVQVVYLLVYVDDILLTGNDSQLISQIVADLNKKFALKTLGAVHYFLGFEVVRNASGLLLTQTKYAQELLHKAGMSESKPCNTPMATGVKLGREDSEAFDQPSLYRSIIGGLQYLRRSTISYSVQT